MGALDLIWFIQSSKPAIGAMFWLEPQLHLEQSIMISGL